MQKIKLLIIGYSSFVRRRVVPSVKKNKKINYFICSKSQKINPKERILFNNYNQALSQVSPNIVYVSLINSLHFKYAKIFLNKGFNVIVDKPITSSLKKTKELLKIAKKKNLLLSEATLFNYHKVFHKMINLSKGKNNILHIQSNFNVPETNFKNLKRFSKIKGDCEDDMAPYAASIIRLFTNNKLKKLNVSKEYIKGSKYVKSFHVGAVLKNCLYLGNFGRSKKYTSQISFFTMDKIIISPQRAFALPSNKNLYITVKKKDKIKMIKIKKDDCIKNFFEEILHSLKNKNYKIFYKKLLYDSSIRDKIKNN